MNPDWWQRHDCRSVWGECDCIHWLADITRAAGGDPDISSEPWAVHSTEKRALAAVRSGGNGLRAEMVKAMERYGWHQVSSDVRWTPRHMFFISDVRYGMCAAAVVSGPQLIVRHPQGVGVAMGTVLQAMEWRAS